MIVLRLAAALVALLWSTATWADPAEDAAHTAKSAADAIILTGPIGALFVLVVIGLVIGLLGAGLVIRALWNTIKERDVAFAALQDKRAAEQVESVKQVASTAISGSAAITASNERLADCTARVQILAERLLPIPEAVADIKLRMGEVARSCGRNAA